MQHGAFAPIRGNIIWPQRAPLRVGDNIGHLLRSQDHLFSLGQAHEQEYGAQGFDDARQEVLRKVTYSLLWAFGYPDSQAELDRYVASLLEWREA